MERTRELWNLPFDIADMEHSFKHIWRKQIDLDL